MMTIQEMKKAIQKSFTKQYGFAPALNQIRPQETYGAGKFIEEMSFCVGNIGYAFSVKTMVVERAEAYDL